MEKENPYKIKNIHWECEDTIIYKNGETEKRVSHNIVVRDVSKLIAGLIGLKITNGVQYWAIGSGDSGWDNLWNTNPPAPTYDDTKLLSEIYRHKIQSSDIKFVDDEGNELPDNQFSNKIKITITVSESQGNGSWREFGLVGGNATTDKNTGLLIDHKFHKVIEKTEEMSVIRKLILEF